jgi:hypothetical protein
MTKQNKTQQDKKRQQKDKQCKNSRGCTADKQPENVLPTQSFSG